MLKDILAWLMIGFGIFLILMIIILEATRESVWINSQYHDLALVFVLGIGIASLYYSHSRIDHLETNATLDKIQEKLDEIKNELEALNKKKQ